MSRWRCEPAARRPDRSPLERLSGGAWRETWAFRAGDRELILRRDPPGRPAEYGAMAVEAAVIGAPTAELLVAVEEFLLGPVAGSNRGQVRFPPKGVG